MTSAMISVLGNILVAFGVVTLILLTIWLVLLIMIGPPEDPGGAP